MIKRDSIKKLKKTKNLLAFSAGVDSSALFFILLSHDIEFDIAIVDYNIRNSSKDEVEHAKQLAKQYNKRIYTKSAQLDISDFENQARIARYTFFEQIIKENDYECLLTAHQLNDKVEWLFISFCRGSGLLSMSGMDEFENRDGYIIARPMISTSRDEIMSYLLENKIKFFEDETNSEEKYTRNYFRKNYSNSLVQKYSLGIKKSFDILTSEKNKLYPEHKFYIYEKLIISKPQKEDNLLFLLDASLKKLGYIASIEQRNEFLETKNCVIGHNFSAVFDNGLLFVAPYIKTTMQKEFKEECRKAKIPAKIRGYLSHLPLSLSDILSGVDIFFGS
jgi:tRNA(Ile)-lysidine synthase